MVLPYQLNQRTRSQTLATLDRVLAKATIRVQRLRDLSAAGDTGKTEYAELQRLLNVDLTDLNDVITAAQTVTGMVQYVRDEKDDANFAAADIIAVRDAMQTLETWIETNLTGGFYDNSQGQLVERTLTSAQTAGFRTEADAFLATVV